MEGIEKKVQRPESRYLEDGGPNIETEAEVPNIEEEQHDDVTKLKRDSQEE